jgi:hypothetical protein
MSIGWLFVLCLALTCVLRARAAALVMLVRAARRGASRLVIAVPVLLAVSVQAHRGAALGRSPMTAIVDTLSTTIATAAPSFTGATRPPDFTLSSKVHARREVFCAPPPMSGARVRSHEPPTTRLRVVAILTSSGRSLLQLGHGRRHLEPGVRRPASRFAAALSVAVGRLRLPRWNALVSALDQEVPRAPGGASAKVRAAGATFATGSS